MPYRKNKKEAHRVFCNGLLFGVQQSEGELSTQLNDPAWGRTRDESFE